MSHDTETSLADWVARQLTNDIVDGRVVAGPRYSVGMLADRLQVGRTPVREALITLQRRGMVTFERNRGVRIVETSMREVEDMFRIRLLLEPPATEWAVPQMGGDQLQKLQREFDLMIQAAGKNDGPTFWRHDRKFHQTILEASGNSRLAEYVDSLRELVLPGNTTTTGTAPKRGFLEVAEEHRPILDAVLRANASEAAEAMRSHIEHTTKLLLGDEAHPT